MAERQGQIGGTNRKELRKGEKSGKGVLRGCLGDWHFKYLGMTDRHTSTLSKGSQILIYSNIVFHLHIRAPKESNFLKSAILWATLINMEFPAIEDSSNEWGSDSPPLWVGHPRLKAHSQKEPTLLKWVGLLTTVAPINHLPLCKCQAPWGQIQDLPSSPGSPKDESCSASTRSSLTSLLDWL